MSRKELPPMIPTSVAEEAIRNERRMVLACLEELLALKDEHLRGGIARLREMVIAGQLKDRGSQGS